MIKTVADLLTALAHEESLKLDSYELEHGPTIGDMYEGLSADLLEMAIPDQLNLQVVTGFVVDDVGNMSGQIDCMLVQGEGERIPHTGKYKWPVGNVLAAFEIKKNLYGGDLKGSFEHLRKVSETYGAWLHGASHSSETFNITSALKSFRQISGIHLSSFSEHSEKLNEEQEILFSTLVVEHMKPLSIVLGYNGYANERTLRKGLLNLLEKNVAVHGWGVQSFPSLITTNDAALIKAVGTPYCTPMQDGYWPFYVSTHKSSIQVLLELIWTRIEMLFNVDMPWGEEDSQEIFHPFLSAKLQIVGNNNAWVLREDPYPEDFEESDPSSISWEPLSVSEIQFATFLELCTNHSVDTTYPDWQLKIRDAGLTVDEFIQSMKATGYVAMDDSIMKLSASQLRCADFPPKGKCVGEDNDGRFSRYRDRITCVNEDA